MFEPENVSKLHHKLGWAPIQPSLSLKRTPCRRTRAGEFGLVLNSEQDRFTTVDGGAKCHSHDVENLNKKHAIAPAAVAGSVAKSR
jgi:hypothetical protein